MPREIIETKTDSPDKSKQNKKPKHWFWRMIYGNDKPEGHDIIEKLLADKATMPYSFFPMPKSKEYQIISELLSQAEHWKTKGDIDIESQIWKMIADKSIEYSAKCLAPLPPSENGLTRMTKNMDTV
jgi:hypothetical protein